MPKRSRLVTRIASLAHRRSNASANRPVARSMTTSWAAVNWCAASRWGESIKKRYPYIDLVAPATQIEKFPEIVAQALAEKRFKPEYDNADLIAQTVWAGVHGVVSLQIAKCNDDWVDWRSIAERTTVMIDVLVDGLAR